MKPLLSYPSIRIKQVFDCLPQSVWQAISEETSLNQWFFPVEDYRFMEGSEFSFWSGEGTTRSYHRCRFLFIEPLSTIEYSWELPDVSKGMSIVRWEIQKEDEKTLLSFTHDGLTSMSDSGFIIDFDHYSKEWHRLILCSLTAHLYRLAGPMNVLY